MLNYSKKCVNTIVICITTFLCIILFIILDACFLNVSDKPSNTNITTSYLNINKNKEDNLNRKDPESVKVGDVFFKLTQVADIYDDPNIRAHEVQDLDEIENESDTENSREKANSNNNETNDDRPNIDVNSKWRIEIPKIGVIAPIKSGTTQDVLATAVGHFKESKKWNGNVALAGHNRGYNCNFFQNIKKLNIGDKIIYYTEKRKKRI